MFPRGKDEVRENAEIVRRILQACARRDICAGDDARAPISLRQSSSLSQMLRKLIGSLRSP